MVNTGSPRISTPTSVVPPCPGAPTAFATQYPKAGALSLGKAHAGTCSLVPTLTQHLIGSNRPVDLRARLVPCPHTLHAALEADDIGVANLEADDS